VKGAPDCYICRHRGTIPGNCHSRCMHPAAGTGFDPIGEVFALLGKRIGPLPIPDTALHVEGHPRGRQSGWFNWPFNFDPTWLISCDGFGRVEFDELAGECERDEGEAS
jgi:hypothetical protein